ncbi:MAG: succinyldiaminopimelate transaminase [Vicinamibacterales bacterium]
MNPRLSDLQPYPFERIRTLLTGIQPAALRPIRLSVGEPQHPTPDFIRDALVRHLDGLAHYPLTAGSDRLREAIAAWYVRRFKLKHLDPATQVLPVNGSREALFAFAQCVVDGSRPGALIACPNPFYQIYEGAALLAGARPVFLNQTLQNGFGLDLDTLSADEWSKVQLLYMCSPGNPTGRVVRLDEWQELFRLADRYGFVIASDECYSEIYFDESAPPLGILEAARVSGRDDYRGLVAFTSLSKRSNVPGLRSGAVAGDAAILREFLRYRTYHGCAMSPVTQEASIAAWNDEGHVRENRDLYRLKFDTVVPLLAPALEAPKPDGGFYLWAQAPGAWEGDDERFTRDLVEHANVAVVPGSYLARDAHALNPGRGYVRIALVATLAECVDAATRIINVCNETLHAPASS